MSRVDHSARSARKQLIFYKPRQTGWPTLALLLFMSEMAIKMTDTAQYHKEIVRRLYEGCANSGHMAPLDEWIAPDFTANSGSKGPAGMADVLNELRTAFPDIHFTIERLIAEGDYVAVRWKWVGTHLGTFRKFPASDKRVTNTGNAIYQFSDRRIVCVWLENDRLGVLQQIGAVAPVATTHG